MLVADAVRDLGQLLVPVACAGCGELDTRLCPRCAGLLAVVPRRVEADVPRLDRLDGLAPLPVWALAPYSGFVRELVLGWKDHGRADLDSYFAAKAQSVGQRLGRVLGGQWMAGPLAVVPAPSTRAAVRRRGRDHTRALAAGFVGGLVDVGYPARLEPVLRRSRGRDQVGRGARDRGGRLHEMDIAGRRRGWAAGRCCVLIDDVVTTGATLAAAENTLVAHGAVVLAAIVIAATPPPSSGPAVPDLPVNGTGDSPVHDGALRSEAEIGWRHSPRRPYGVFPSAVAQRAECPAELGLEVVGTRRRRGAATEFPEALGRWA